MLALLLGSRLPALGQVVIVYHGDYSAAGLSNINATVVDSLTNEPVPYASVYVIPAKDTLITNFTLSDTTGKAKLTEVPFGRYSFHVEMMGYKHFVRDRWFRGSRIDMGTIKLQADEQFLNAAVVSDVGNPIVIKQDTIEFNASSYRVGSNAMLGDLLKRMPGMEISGGKVKFNGEAIKKLTVGGRTFFFDDQSTALNNLPASIVDKIRVIDRESEKTRTTGIDDGTREKVLDVGLKKEYEKGWFGNAGLKGGATAGGKEEQPLRDERGLLYDGNALVSAYGEKDQVTLVGGARNVGGAANFGGGLQVQVLGDMPNSFGGGLSSTAQAGVNLNSSRIKDVETSASANYNYTDTDSGSRSYRTTFQEDGDLLTDSGNTGKSFSNTLDASLELKKEKGDTRFTFNTLYKYGTNDSRMQSESGTVMNGVTINSSNNFSRALSTDGSITMIGNVTFRNALGKEGRTIGISARGALGSSEGQSDENSRLLTLAGEDVRVMHYDSDGRNWSVGGILSYTEKLGEKWSIESMADASIYRHDNVRLASDQNGHNEYYSSDTRNFNSDVSLNAGAKYRLNKSTSLGLGGRLSGTLNELRSKSFGVQTTTGEGEWTWLFSPSASIQYNSGKSRLWMSGSGFAITPSADVKLPVLNTANASRLSLGNAYLRPSQTFNFSGNWSISNREHFSTFMLYTNGNVTSNGIGNALWYDTDGIMYSIPVNVPKPSANMFLNFSYTAPLDKDRKWFLTLTGGSSYSTSTSYQATGKLPALDKDSFVYSDFMADFWGGETGERFYSGKSGFTQARTRSLNPVAAINMRYNRERLSLYGNVDLNGRLSRYSLAPDKSDNTLVTRISCSGTYTTKHEFDFSTYMAYVFYSGYPEGYGIPEWQWNASISKNVGAFNISLTLHDILNQTRSLSHTFNANYQEDTYRLVLGRYILLGIKWNFGKMNASHSRRAQNASWSMGQ